MKFIFIKAGEKAKIVEFEGKKISYEKLKEYLTFDSPLTVATRTIGGKLYDIWLDDEGLLKPEDQRIVSGCLLDEEHPETEELLCGDLLICKSDKQGNSIGLTDNECFEIMFHLVDMDVVNRCQGNNPDEDTILQGYFDGGKFTVKAHSNIVGYSL